MDMSIVVAFALLFAALGWVTLAYIRLRNDRDAEIKRLENALSSDAKTYEKHLNKSESEVRSLEHQLRAAETALELAHTRNQKALDYIRERSKNFALKAVGEILEGKTPKIAAKTTKKATVKK